MNKDDVLLLPQVHVLDHPLIEHKLAELRSVFTHTGAFRTIVKYLAGQLIYEALRDDTTYPRKVTTPLVCMDAYVIREDLHVLAPVLRAGLGMLEGAFEALPNAPVAHIGMYRDEVTKEPHVYFSKAPDEIVGREIDILDPMCATGGSALAAIEYFQGLGIPEDEIKLLHILAAPEGLETIVKHHPAVRIYCAAVDDHLNENAFIVPGLGDAGDRLYGTK